MNNEILSLKTAQNLRDYELLKKFIKKEIEKENYVFYERIKNFIEILEEKEKEKNE